MSDAAGHGGVEIEIAEAQTAGIVLGVRTIAHRDRFLRRLSGGGGLGLRESLNRRGREKQRGQN